MKRIAAGVLQVAFDEQGAPQGTPVFLLHGFPYDVRAFDAVVPQLVAAGCRVITPYLRGYGPTRFRTQDTMRSGQQAALAHDLLALMDALARHRRHFTGPFERRVIPGVGHNLPQEAPDQFAAAILSLASGAFLGERTS